MTVKYRVLEPRERSEKDKYKINIRQNYVLESHH